MATVIGSTRRVTFQIPTAIAVGAPTAYLVSLAGRTTTGVAFASSNTASLTVNPPPKIVSLSPDRALQGSTAAISIVTQYTNFVQGATQASFGSGISVGGGADGGFGFVTVTSPTSATAQITIKAAAASGLHTATVTTGVQVAALADSFHIDVPTPPNRAPLISSSPSLAAVTGQPYGYAVQASDPDGDVVTVSLTQAPAGMTMGATGVIGWTPGAAQVGPHAVTVQVVDGKGGIVTQSFTIQVTAANHPPVITSAPVVSGTEAVSYRYQLVATDPDGDGLTYTLTPFPSGMTVTAAGLLAWTPSAAQVGAQPVTVGVSDGKGGAASQSFTITVAAANHPPVITSAPVVSGTEAVSYRYQLVATDPDGDVVTFSLTQAPAGMTITNGAIAWTPSAAQVGAQPVTVGVSDGKGGAASQSFTITVAAANHPPVITSAPVVSGTEAVSYRYQLVATDPDGDGLTYTLTQAPAGMTVTERR